MAAVLTGLMILLFLGNWRLTLIILVSIPLSVVTAMLGMYCLGQTLNTMTLGGFALATGILVDDATVVIENIERHVGMGEPVDPAIINGTAEILLPTFLSTLSICIVFIPVFLLQGTATLPVCSAFTWLSCCAACKSHPLANAGPRDVQISDAVLHREACPPGMAAQGEGARAKPRPGAHGGPIRLPQFTMDSRSRSTHFVIRIATLFHGQWHGPRFPPVSSSP